MSSVPTVSQPQGRLQPHADLNRKGTEDTSGVASLPQEERSQPLKTAPTPIVAPAQITTPTQTHTTSTNTDPQQILQVLSEAPQTRPKTFGDWLKQSLSLNFDSGTKP